MPMKVMSTLVGMEMTVTRVERIESRNTRITSTAKTRPRPPSSASDEIDCWMKGAWSKTTVTLAPDPSLSSMSGIWAFTSFETSTVLAEGNFVTAMVSAGLPSTREIELAGSSPSATDATSPIAFTPPAKPCGLLGTSGRADMSSTDPSCAPDCTLRVLSPSVTEPPGISTPFCCSASVIDCRVSPAAASFVTSGVMVMRWPIAPTSAASLTPCRSLMSGIASLVMSDARVFWSASLVTASCTTGRSSKLPLSTCGSTPSGSVDVMRLIAWSSFCSAVARLVP